MNENTRFAQAIGWAALQMWPELAQDVQERLFEKATGGDAILRHELAQYLHDHHPRTAHPSKPTAVA